MNDKKITGEKKFVRDALMLEAILASFGFAVRIAKVNDYKDSTQYCLDLAIGTPIQDLLKLDRDIAIGLASPTGSIEIQAPIPNSSLIGITVPKHDKYNKQKPGELLRSYALDFEHMDTKLTQRGTGKISHLLYILGNSIITLSSKIGRK